MPIARNEVTITKVTHEPPEPTKSGVLLVWHWHVKEGNDISSEIGQPSMHYYSVNTPDEAKELIRELIREELDDDSVSDNAFGLEVSVMKGNANKPTYYPRFEYEEWVDGDGDDIMAVMVYEDDENF